MLRAILAEKPGKQADTGIWIVRRMAFIPFVLMTNMPYFIKIIRQRNQDYMRKVQKKQSEDFIKLLGQAHVEVRKAIEKRQNAIAMDLLEQCQDGAIELGNMIEAEEGENFITIPLLEQYCELVYQIHEELWKNQYVSGDKVYKGLKKSLIRIENSVKNHIKIHREAVFLPYKASMWDSLESIWKAAD